jgi:hypothetical protein
LPVTNDPATLDALNANWIYLGFKIPVTSGHINGYCLFDNGTFKGMMWSTVGYKDDGTVWPRPDNCPATAPSTATNQNLTAKVLSGAGTTSLVLDTNAGASTSGKFTFHDATPAFNLAMTDAKADWAGNGGAGPEVLCPFGTYRVSRLNIDTYKMDAFCHLSLTGYPITINNAGVFEGHGAAVPNGTPYASDKLNVTPNNTDGFLIQGFSGTIRNVQIEASNTHDLVIPHPSQVVIDNFHGIHTTGGDCGLIGGDGFFTVFHDTGCDAANISRGAATNRAAWYLSNTQQAAGGDWVELHWQGTTFLENGPIYIDSPAPINASGALPIGKFNDMLTLDAEGVFPSVFVVDPGCQNSPVNIKAGWVAMTIMNPVTSDNAVSLFSNARASDSGCIQWSSVFGSNIVIGGDSGGAGDSSTIITSGGNNNGQADLGTTFNETVIGGGVLSGGALLANFSNNTGADFAGAGYLMPPPTLTVLNDFGAGGTCPDPLTRYFMVSAGDGAGGWSKASTELPLIAYASGHSEITQVFYGTTFGAGFIAPKYRIWVGTSPGAENQYFETTDPGQFKYSCGAPTGTGTPPVSGNAYFWKIPSGSAEPGPPPVPAPPGWYGIASTDLFGFGKVTPAYSVDSSGTINADAAFRLNAKLMASATAPTIASGFGTSPAIVRSNGTAAFTVNVGTGNTGTGVITMPAAPNAWACNVTDTTSTTANVFITKSLPTSASSITLQNYTDVSATHAWVDSDVLAVTCVPY